MQRAIWILWPSFIVAAAAEAVFFAMFDPSDLMIFGESPHWSRTGVYTLGFFLFWAFAAAASAATCFLQRSAAEVNRLCPLEPSDRPPGCPRRPERDDTTGRL